MYMMDSIPKPLPTEDRDSATDGCPMCPPLSKSAPVCSMKTIPSFIYLKL